MRAEPNLCWIEIDPPFASDLPACSAYQPSIRRIATACTPRASAGFRARSHRRPHGIVSTVAIATAWHAPCQAKPVVHPFGGRREVMNVRQVSADVRSASSSRGDPTRDTTGTHHRPGGSVPALHHPSSSRVGSAPSPSITPLEPAPSPPPVRLPPPPPIPYQRVSPNPKATAAAPRRSSYMAMSRVKR